MARGLIENARQLKVTIEQMGRLLTALTGVHERFQQNPQLSALTAEACLDDLKRLQTEALEFVSELCPPMDDTAAHEPQDQPADELRV